MEEKYTRKEIKKINRETMDRQKGNRQPWRIFAQIFGARR